MKRDIVGVLLAAGASSRFGADKLVQSLPSGERIVAASARNLRRALPDSLAVTRIDADAVASTLCGCGLSIILSAHAAGGLGNSLACGVRGSSNAAGWVIALGDMPYIRPSTIATVAQALREGAAICAPVFAGRRGHPIGFSAEFFEELATLRGDFGARSLLKAHAKRITLLPVEDPGVHCDIDTPEDLRPSARRTLAERTADAPPRIHDAP